MRETLIDLTRHCRWADAEHWGAFEGHPGALTDAAALERLHHIHLVQYAFVSIVRGEEVDPKKGEDLSPPELRAWGEKSVSTLLELARTLSDNDLTEVFEVPWFKDPPIKLNRGEAILQACLHSQYHRAQNATRLRELGGEPPTTDYIVWIWKERPEPALQAAD